MIFSRQGRKWTHTGAWESNEWTKQEISLDQLVLPAQDKTRGPWGSNFLCGSFWWVVILNKPHKIENVISTYILSKKTLSLPACTVYAVFLAWVNSETDHNPSFNKCFDPHRHPKHTGSFNWNSFQIDRINSCNISKKL